MKLIIPFIELWVDELTLIQGNWQNFASSKPGISTSANWRGRAQDSLILSCVISPINRSAVSELVRHSRNISCSLDANSKHKQQRWNVLECNYSSPLSNLTKSKYADDKQKIHQSSQVVIRQEREWREARVMKGGRVMMEAGWWRG